jgi:beta-lactamase regulating signal transducer with metallopeptidase domain
MMSQIQQFTVAAWMITYLVHSTVLLAAVWAIARMLRCRQEPLIELLWRFALIAPLVTASLQIGLSVQPLMGALPVPDRVALDNPLPSAAGTETADAATVAPDHPRPAPQAGQLIDTPPARQPAADENTGLFILENGTAEASGPMIARPGKPSVIGGSDGSSHTFASVFGALNGSDYLISVTFVIALALTISAARSIACHLRLRVLMRDRRPITDGPALTMLRRLQRRSPMRRTVRLTCSNHLTVPIACGVIRPEICLPACVLEHFDPTEQEGVLAHELAHHVRRDPAWQMFASALAGLLFFQPLNVLACRRLRELAELACDRWAAEQTGDRITLAHCLAQVAGWIVQGRAEPALQRAMGMAGRPSALRRRITRLLDDAPDPRSREVRRWFFALAPLLLALTVWAVPGVGAPPQTMTPRNSDEGPGIDREASHAEQTRPSLWQGATALQRDLEQLDAELDEFRETADRLPLNQPWMESIDELADRAQRLRDRNEHFVAVLRGASAEGAREEVGDRDENDELDY